MSVSPPVPLVRSSETLHLFDPCFHKLLFEFFHRMEFVEG
jgi:hypothetical protein